MKSPQLAIPTLSPVRRAAAFLMSLALLTLSSCGEDPDSPAAIMDEQSRVFEEMAAVLNEVAKGGNQKAAAEELTRLGEELKALKVKLAGVDSLKDQEQQGILDLERFQEATAARQKAFEKIIGSVSISPELQQALMAHHNPNPMPGEGSIE